MSGNVDAATPGGPLGLEAIVARVSELDGEAVASGRLAGRVEVLVWMQDEIQLSLRQWGERDRFADLRAVDELLKLVQDSLAGVQDGTGRWSGLVRRDLGALETGTASAEGVPTA